VRLRPVRSLPRRGIEWTAARMSAAGESHGIDWLTYNPLQVHLYHRVAASDAPAVIAGLDDVFPDRVRYVDVGAGSGAFAAEALRRGKVVAACERSLPGRLYARSQGLRCVPFDLRRDPPARLGGPFDLAYCFEVAEHLPPSLGDRLVTFLVGLAPLIVFTAAPPGQGGLGHVNERAPEYWIDRFSANGAAHDGRASRRLSSAIGRVGVASSWFRENVMVFGSAGGT